MKIKDVAAKPVVSVQADAPLAEAAALMDVGNVGTLLVMDGERPVGIVTDRDIVVSGIARRVPLGARIDSMMTTQLITVDANEDVHEAYRLFNSHAIRRLPVVDEGEVVGMLSIDDLLVALAGDLERLVRPIVGELAFGFHPAPAPALR